MIMTVPSARSHSRRGAVAITTVIVLIMIYLVVIAMGVSISRDHDLTVRRVQAIEALYAAEAGTQMSIRELLVPADEDGDGGTGTISDDSDDGTDPTLGRARFVVTTAGDTPAAGQTTITSVGRSGEAKRAMQVVVK